MTEPHYDHLVLWYCKYDLASKIDTCTWSSGVWSTTPRDAKMMQTHWDLIHSAFYTLSNFSTRLATPEDGECNPHIIKIHPR